MIFCISTSISAEYYYVPRVSYIHTYIYIYIVQKLHPTRTLLFILTWGGVWCGFLSFC